MDWQGWFVPRSLLRRREPALSLTPPAEDDVAKLDALREAGSKLRLPHPVRCFLLFESEADARATMGLLEKEGTRAQIRAEPDGRWTLTVVEMLVPSPGAITRLRETLTAAAEGQGGRFLDWSAPVVC
jgi:Regulator of ribonuclease activity B